MIEHNNLSIIAFFLRSLAVDAAFLGLSGLGEAGRDESNHSQPIAAAANRLIAH